MLCAVDLAARRDVREFFRAKVDEQRKRHDRFQDFHDADA